MNKAKNLFGGLGKMLRAKAFYNSGYKIVSENMQRINEYFWKDIENKQELIKMNNPALKGEVSTTKTKC